MSRRTGNILFYSSEKGFGFIRMPGLEADVFFHIGDSDLAPESLKKGAQVSFEVGEDHRGREAAVGLRLL